MIRRGRIQMVFAKKEKKKEYRVRSEENKFFLHRLRSSLDYSEEN